GTERAANHEHMGLIGANGKTASSADRRYDRGVFCVHDRSWNPHLTQHVDLLHGSAREVEIILWFDSDVLGKVALLKELLQIDCKLLPLAHHKASLQVDDVDLQRSFVVRQGKQLAIDLEKLKAS